MQQLRRSVPLSLLVLTAFLVTACASPPNVATTDVPASPTPLPLPGAMATTPAASMTEAPSAAPAGSTTESPAAASGSVEMPATSPDLTGASLYALSCAQCHGKDRSGSKFEVDGQTIEVPALAWDDLNNLYTTDTSRGDVPAQLALAITKGEDESGDQMNAMMPHWSGFTQEQVQSLIDYLQSAGTGTTEGLALSPAATGMQGGLLFTTACAACHGLDGAGRTFEKDGNSISPPTLHWGDLNEMYSENPDRGSVADQLNLAITKGEDEGGDQMPAMMPRWTFLSEAQVSSLVEYLQSAFK
jgi:mono/diheme cytochrome c family protein